jgi:uncharacterized protein YkwD
MKNRVMLTVLFLAVLLAVAALFDRPAPAAPLQPRSTPQPRGSVTQPAAAATDAANVTSAPQPPAPPPDTATPPPDVPAAASPAPTAVTAAQQTYTVQAGDTLLGIARAYGVSLAALQLANDMPGETTVYVGQLLVIPEPIPGESLFWVAYRLVPGDTLYGVAKRFGVSSVDLARVNNLGDEAILLAGQVLIIPTNSLVDVAEPPATVAPPAATAIAAGTTSARSPTGTPDAAPTLVPIPPSGGNDAWIQELFALINQARAENGLPPLTYNVLLAVSAQGQANDCSQRGWCSHTGSDGSTWYVRIARAGYAASGASECWAWSFTPQSTFTAWFDEPPGADPHRQTILSTRYQEVGIGIAPAPSNGWFFIADFGRP